MQMESSSGMEFYDSAGFSAITNRSFNHGSSDRSFLAILRRYGGK